MQQLFDHLREQWVAYTPEEEVRQKWVEVMLNHLKFPRELLVVEKQLCQLPHLKNQARQLPNRRLDILAYTKVKSKLIPLIVIECKCIPLSKQTALQVWGYNEYIQAPYVAMANGDEIIVSYQKGENELEFLNFLPDYDLLLKAIG